MNELKKLMTADVLDIPSTFICEACGEEVASGLLNRIRHDNICPHDAPNSSIERHHLDERIKRYEKETKARIKREEKEFDLIWQQMTVEERQELFLLQCNGMWDSTTNTVYMGIKAFERLHNYKREMKIKYGNQKKSLA